MKRNLLLTMFMLCSAVFSSLAQQYDPGSGNTLMLVGQTFKSEYDGYKSGVGLTPAGSSHYATFYLGAIEQGDDNPNSVFLDHVRSTQTDPYALVALSFKDNTGAGGYGQMTDDSQPLNTNAVWDALKDVTTGVWDDEIDAFSQDMASRSDTKFLLRIGYEVSLLLFAYSGSEYVVDWLNTQAGAGVNVFDDPDQVADMDRQAYIDAYNYIANRIRNVNSVSNVDFVYHPVRGFNDTQWLYPGSQFVDWVAFSIFNNDVCVEVNGTFNCEGEGIDPQLQMSIDFAKEKGHPIMIAEAAVQAPASSTASTFIDYLNRLHQVVVDNDVRVLAYINSNWPIHGWGPEWGDSRVEVNNSVLNHWKSTFGDGTRYLHSGDAPDTGGGDGGSGGGDGGSGGGDGGSGGGDGGGSTDCAGSCPTGYDYFLCGQCWVSEAQAQSGGCTETCSVGGGGDGGSGGGDGGSGGGGGGGSADCAGSCPTGYDYFLCGQCWVSEAQAQSGGCTETCSGSGGGGDGGSGGGGGGATLLDPTGLAASASSSSIFLSWTDNATSEDGYAVERSTGGSFAVVATLAANATSYTDASVSQGNTYSYRVRATEGSDVSGYSNTASATVPTSGGGGGGGGGSADLAFLEPIDGRTLMILGQDLASVSNYQSNCASCPTMGGVTSYVAFYDINNGGAGYGALGFTTADQPTGPQGDLDWGGGPLNAHSAAVGFPNSALQIGLNIAEGNNGGLWCAGCLGELASPGGGQFSDEIDQLADFFNSIPSTPVYLRVGYEFDGKWNDGYQNRSTYIAAYKNIVDGLRAKGVSNVAYVWQASASPIDDILDGGAEDYMDWYPGDNYVDWVAISWFQLPNETAPVGGFLNDQLSQANQMATVARNLGKPLMIAESTAQGYDIGGGRNCNISPVWDGAAGAGCVNKSGGQIWNEWFVPYFNWIRSNSDIVKAVSYINANWDTQGLWAPPYTQGYWGDTRIEANSTVESNWVNELSDGSFWLHGSANLASQLNGGSALRTTPAQSLNINHSPLIIKLFPNPATAQLNIQGASDDFAYHVFDIRGVQLMKGQGNVLDISSLQPGLYYLKGGSTTLKFIKE